MQMSARDDDDNDNNRRPRCHSLSLKWNLAGSVPFGVAQRAAAARRQTECLAGADYNKRILINGAHIPLPVPPARFAFILQPSLEPSI